MNFLNPFFLLALIAAVMPIVIHLVNLRKPQKISFSTLSFINELRKSTIRRIRIKQYLLMALRVMAVLLLALALARPFLPPTLNGTSSSNQPAAIAILIDNSASMSRIGSSGPLIDQAKEVANRIIENGTSDDKFFITTTNANNINSTAFTGAARARDAIEDISTVQTGRDTKQKIVTAYQQLQNMPQPQAFLYVISDGQESQFANLEDLKLSQNGSEDKAVSLQLITFKQPKQQNIAVSSMSLNSQMLSKGSEVTLAVEIENTGATAVVNQFVSLEVKGELSGQYQISLDSGESKEFLFKILPETTGDITGKIIIEGDELEYDNSRYFVLRIPRERSILLINDEQNPSSFTSYLEPALEAAKQTNAQLSFVEKQPSQVDQAGWQRYEAIVFDGLEEIPEYWFRDLQRYVQDGGGVVFLPSEQGDLGNYNRFFSLFNGGQFDGIEGEYASFKTVAKLADLEEGHAIIDELFSKKEDETIRVDQPSLFFYYHYQEPSNSGSLTILKATNDDPLLSEQNFGKGVLLVSTVGADPGWSNFPVNPLFAPLYYRTILYASSSEKGGLQQHQLGQPFLWEGPSQNAQVTLQINGTDFKPKVQRRAEGLRITDEAKEWEPGILHIVGTDEEYKVAVNQNIMESHFETLENQQWQNMFGDVWKVNTIINVDNLSADTFNEELNTAAFGEEIWDWFLWLALLFLVIESFVSRIYKAESIS